VQDLDNIIELISAVFAAVVGLMVLLTWLEATLVRDERPGDRQPGRSRQRRPTDNDEASGTASKDD
jgi:hypothetical protein